MSPGDMENDKLTRRVEELERVVGAAARRLESGECLTLGRLEVLERDVAELKGQRDRQRSQKVQVAVRKLIRHRDAYRDGAPRLQLVLSYQQAAVLADLIESELGGQE